MIKADNCFNSNLKANDDDDDDDDDDVDNDVDIEDDDDVVCDGNELALGALR